MIDPVRGGVELPTQAPRQLSSDQERETITLSRKPLYRKPLFYIILFIVIVAAGLFTFFFFRKVQTDNDISTAEYETGLSKDQVAIQLVNDEEIERYPILDLNVAGLNVYLNTFEGLTVYRGAMLEPGLAESWTNPDPLTWHFKLRRGVKFQSGDEFTAQDVKYTIEQAKASEREERAWFSQFMAARIDSVKVIDDYMVELKTQEPDATLLNWLVYVGMVSKDQVTRDGLSNAVGTGPYKIKKIAKREAQLEAYQEYWDGVPKVKNVVYKVVPDSKAALQSLKSGEFDIIWQSKPVSNDLLSNRFYTTMHNTSGIVYITLDTNSVKTKYVTSEKNPFRDNRVRKAMLRGLDIPSLTSDAGISADPVTQFVTKDLIGYNPQLKSSIRDIAEAKRLLAEAGYPNGFTVTFITDNQPDHVNVVTAITKQFAEIGITVKPKVLDAGEYVSSILSGDFSMLLSYYYPDTRDSLDLIDTLFHTPNGSHGIVNISSYSNSELDAVLDSAISTFNIQKRSLITGDAHRIIMDELPAIPLYTENFQIIARDDISYKFSLTILLLGYDLSGRQLAQ